MRLLSIQLNGFKSFADDITIYLKGDCMGVVGPNGCGKSNIMDALRWVLGESKASELRGENMQDVIFNGSHGRKPAYKASVTLLFDNQDGQLKGEWGRFTQVSVGRSLDRENRSNYYINQQIVRRKDVQDLFMGTGLGAKAYAIIGQGTVNRIIESKPEELRLFFEEAAGISKYKERRKETYHRLEDAKEHCNRLQDILFELTHSVDKLFEQAEKAKQYQNTQAQQLEHQVVMNHLLAQQSKTHIEQLQIQQHTLKIQLEDNQNAQFEVEQSLYTHQSKHDLRQQQFEAAQQAMQSANFALVELQSKQHYQQQQQQDLIEDISFNSEQLNDYQIQYQEIEEALFELEAQHEALNEKQFDVISIDLSDYQQKLKQAQYAKERWQKEQQQQQQNLALLKQKKEFISTQLSSQKSQIGQISELNLTQTMDEQEIEHAKHTINLLEIEQQRLQIKLPNILASITQLNTALEFAKQEQLPKQQAMQTAYLDLEKIKAYQQQLQGMQEAEQQHKQSILPLFTVQNGWEQAISHALGGYLHAKLIEPEHALLTLKQQACSVLYKQLETPSVDSYSLMSKITIHDLTLYTALNDCLQMYKICNHYEEALDWQVNSQQSHYQYAILADGTIFAKNAIILASKQDKRLERQRQLMHATQEIEAKTLIFNEKQTLHQQNLQSIEALQEQLASYKQQQSILEQAIASQTLTLQDQQQQLQLKQQQLTIYIKQLEENQAKALLAKQSILEFEQTMLELETQILELQASIEQINEMLYDAEEQQQKAEETLEKAQQQQQQQQLNQQAYQLKIVQISQQLTQLKQNKQQIQKFMQDLQQKLDKQQQQKNQLQEAVNEMHISEQLQTLEFSKQQFNQAQNALSDSLLHRQKLEQQLKQLQTELKPLYESIHQFALKLENQQNQLNQYTQAQTIFEETLSKAKYTQPNMQALPKHLQQSIPEHKQSIAKLQHELDDLGYVNLMAVEEYSQSKQRLDELTAQQKDVLEAISILEHAILDIDQESRALLQDTFEHTNRLFGELFPQLFGGGQAKLIQQGEDMLEAGICVTAQPPGKKNSSIYLLSGGEKALTAIALIFAMFKRNPAPFCLLDEVDAPLDDANTERYAQLIKNMTAYTQFVFISHNPLAMEIADDLIGVTMQEKGISKIVSVNMQQAMANLI